MGRGCAKCGAEYNILALSCNASFTILYCSKSSCIIAFCKYLTPPWMSFVLLLEVPLAKSSPSIKAVLRPLVAASRAQPAPVAPPPMMTTSKLSVWRDLSCSSRVGSGRLMRLGATCWARTAAHWQIQRNEELSIDKFKFLWPPPTSG